MLATIEMKLELNSDDDDDDDGGDDKKILTKSNVTIGLCFAKRL